MIPPDLHYVRRTVRATRGGIDRGEILAKTTDCTLDDVVDALLRVGTPEQVKQGLGEVIALRMAAKDAEHGPQGG